ncbi:protein-glutamate O-methyltransferase CheR [Ramlibacter sp.]|uniref:CheR family methyltransferase n=1 Tax=Ramlibacter sp. TaxID=1917967 RepID=UPI00261552BC|nr:protein-glutamate O-methyltransferase CheR [Ramlibacter sp.]MDB5957008.1 methyltransferase, CheR-type [Ramlibacter sp.]
MTLDVHDIEIRLLIEAIFLRYGHDFRDYAQASLRRRVLQAQLRMDAASISALQERVLHDPGQFAQLLQYLTVPVSEMFRDPAYFLALRRHVVPVLRTYPSLKVWVAGCSTGEEPYSLAILLLEEGLLERTILYATDINHASLEKARAGIFNLEAMQGFTRNYQRAGGAGSFSDYYTAAYGGAVFDKRLRDAITFADHSLATDAVFSETHLVSCRNVLIYFNRGLQDRALGLFHESLAYRGFLGMGSKETLDFSAYADRFESVSRPDRIYRKLPGRA